MSFNTSSNNRYMILNVALQVSNIKAVLKSFYPHIKYLLIDERNTIAGKGEC